MLYLPPDGLPTDHPNADLTGRRADPAAPIGKANGSHFAHLWTLASSVEPFSGTSRGADGNPAVQR